MRVSAFIDGFNVYHSLVHLDFPPFKWLDYFKLARSFKQKDWIIQRVLYFTSYANWNPEKVERHRCYVNVLKDTGVEVVFGKFKRISRTCHREYAHDLSLHLRYFTHEEKRTDVNIGIHLIDGAYRNDFDTALLISGDTDLVPAIELVKSRFPSKQVHVVIPRGRRVMELENVCDAHYKIRTGVLKHCLLPNPYLHSSGMRIACPHDWEAHTSRIGARQAEERKRATDPPPTMAE